MRRELAALLLTVLTASACTGEAGTDLTTLTAAATTSTTEVIVVDTAETIPAAPTTASTLGSSLPLPFEPDSLNPGVLEAHLFVSSSGVEFEYLLFAPLDYEAARSWPLIISLHGFLGQSPSLEAVANQNPAVWVDSGVDFPFLVLAPLASGSWSRFHEPIVELIGVLAESISVNQEALFLTGISAGAPGAWEWALSDPERFAGLAVVAGGSGNVDVLSDLCRLGDLPIWVAHSEDDANVPIDGDAEIVTGLEGCGSTSVQFVTYQGLDHGQSISVSYAGPDLYQWMLEQVP